VIAPRDSEGIRLAKRVAELCNCSRRQAEQFIQNGFVRVNGQVVQEPPFRVTTHTIEIDSNATVQAPAPITILLHKPPDITEAQAQATLNPTTHFAQDTSDERVLKRHFNALTRHVPLEAAASGLIVFTQDWRVARKLDEDAALLEHEFMVHVAGEITSQSLLPIERALKRHEPPLPATKVSVSSSGEGRSSLRFAVKGSQPGLIAFLCDLAELKILAIKRQRIGRVAMAQLPQGQWRYLLAHERF
jgi:23S rRNA pseudouridine2604 synthase